MSDITHLEELILDLSKSVKNIETDMTQVKGRLDSMDGRLDSMDGRLDSMDGRLDSMDGRLDSMDSRLDSIDARLDRVEDSLMDLREDFQSESIATRSLLNQAFEHISDQIAEPDHKPIPSLIFRSRRTHTVDA